MQAIIDEEVEKMERDGVIEPSHSAWSSPIVLVKKKDNTYRFCVDYRRVNEATEQDAYPLPQITATLDKLRGARYLTTLDLKSGYWQIPLDANSKPITAFTIPGRGLMQFRVMPFGLHSAPATFQRLLDEVLGPELEPRVFVYLDDIIIISQSFEEHLKILKEVFRRLRQAKLRLNPEKCHFCLNRLKYLGHIVDGKGIRTDPEKVDAVVKWPTPTTVKGIRQFLGMASWYRRFLPRFSNIAAPLTNLTRKNARWKWGEEEDRAFQLLKDTLVSAPVLACPDFSRRFILQTDASTTGLGAVLTQNFPEGERVIAYASRTLNPAERNYSATELECLAVIWGIRRMRSYLEGYEFTVITDHQSLRWLQKMESPSGRLGRWSFELQQYQFDIRYRKGCLNRVADALSRQPVACLRERQTDCTWYQQTYQRVSEKPTEYPDYAIKDGHLFRHILHSNDFREIPYAAQWKRCAPTEMRREILQQNHDSPTAGHLGVAKTIFRIAQKYYWPGMYREIARYVRSCRNCLAHKAHQAKPAGLMHATPVTRPWQQVTTDLIGPLPRSTSGHVWLLTMQDRFSKWLEIRPLRKATAHAVVNSLTESVILRHGCPERIVSDNGTQYKSAQMSQMLQKFGIEHRTAPVHAPHCNPVERTNRSIKTMISQYVNDDHRLWDKNLVALQFAYNTARHDVTGYTPAFLNYGRELNCPPSETGPEEEAADDPEARRDALQDTYKLVQMNLSRAFQRQARYYDLRRRPWKPALGEQVWKKTHFLSAKAEGFNAKLAGKYVGPLLVRKIHSPVIVDLQDEGGKWYRHVHVQDLKPAPKTETETETETESSDEDD